MMQIHHIGYLVDDIAGGGAVCEFEKLGYVKQSNLLFDSVRQIYILFMENNGYVIELIQPAGEESPIYGLRKRYRNSPYHICYCTDDLCKEIERMQKSGYTLIQPPQTATEITGQPKVAFLFSQQIGIVELIEDIENA